MKIQLQLALDMPNKKKAIKIANQTAKFIDIIEAGTPLIKEESLHIVKTFKKRFPKKKILADMKTMDVGALEAKLAFDAGADITTVCLSAPKETILSAINSAKKNKQVMLDTIGLNKKEILIKLKQLKKRPLYICLHRAIDEKLHKSITNLLACIKDIKRLTKNKVKIAVAGSINDKIARQIMALKEKPDIVIVGSAITKAKNPEIIARKIKEILK
ncbi:MAG: orotidine 5'-phosphate decarboxylase [Candidatus Pacearchaeota archaeon]|nr:MAG: orotidine 5'-phosphate decarboxylase [Candidatus Pacearchaeota archaeon]